MNFVDPLGFQYDKVDFILDGIYGNQNHSDYSAYAEEADQAFEAEVKPAITNTLTGSAISLGVLAGLGAAPYIAQTSYYIAPYSGPIVDFTYGLFPETGLPKGWGYLSTGGMFIYQKLKEYFTDDNPSPCGNK